MLWWRLYLRATSSQPTGVADSCGPQTRRSNWLQATWHSCYVGGMSRAADDTAALEPDLTLTPLASITLLQQDDARCSTAFFRGTKVLLN